MSGTIETTRQGPVARVSIGQPARRNALTVAMWQDLADAMTALDLDLEIRCVLLEGAGGADFSTGADIAEFASTRADEASARAYDATVRRAFAAIRHCRHPVVAMIRGHCLGGALSAALMADIRLATPSARFGIPGARLGLGLGYDEVQRLLVTVGPAAAAEILLTGRSYGADEALAMRIVSRIVDEGALEAEASDIARDIVAAAPLTNRWHKEVLRQLTAGPVVSTADRDRLYALCHAQDWHEGYRAFLEKRPPRFEGR